MAKKVEQLSSGNKFFLFTILLTFENQSAESIQNKFLLFSM